MCSAALLFLSFSLFFFGLKWFDGCILAVSGRLLCPRRSYWNCHRPAACSRLSMGLMMAYAKAYTPSIYTRGFIRAPHLHLPQRAQYPCRRHTRWLWPPQPLSIPMGQETSSFFSNDLIVLIGCRLLLVDNDLVLLVADYC